MLKDEIGNRHRFAETQLRNWQEEWRLKRLGEIRAENLHFVSKIISCSQEGASFLLKCITDKGRKVTLEVQFCSPRVIRFCLVPEGASEIASSEMVVEKEWAEVELTVAEDEEQIAIDTGTVVLGITKDPYEFSISDSRGVIICKENLSDMDVTERLKIKPLGFCLESDGRVTSTFETLNIEPEEHFYGFGEKFFPLDKRGQEVTCWLMDAFGASAENSYKAIPFFVSTKGYGIFVNSTFRVLFQMGTQSCISYTFENSGPWLEFYFIYGPSFADILDQYSDITGKAPVPPKWSFGLWTDGGAYPTSWTQRDLEDVVGALERHDIPTDVISVDPFWMRRRKYCDFQWDKESFPDPEGMLRMLKSKGLQLCLWIMPYISIESEMYLEAKERGYLVLREDGTPYHVIDGLAEVSIPGKERDPDDPKWAWNAHVALVDFSNPEAVAWFKEKIRAVVEMGVASFMTDFAEGVPEDARFHNGMSGEEMHNLYPLVYNKAVYEALEAFSEKGEAAVAGRSGCPGIQRHPISWIAGDPGTDFATMSCVLRAGLGFGLSGVPFSMYDLGGVYRQPPEEEVYIRWTQMALLSSNVRCHGASSRHPWKYGERALRIFRQFCKLRYRLIPFLYSYAHVAARTGLPIQRAMVLEYQDDPNTYHLDLQYMLGRELLVAPIFDESNKRRVYLPAGKWIDYWRGEEYDGPTYLDYAAALELIPLFIKGDSILPLGPEANRVPEKAAEPLTMDIYCYQHAKFDLYEEEGMTSITCSREENQLLLEISPSKRTYIAIFNKTDRPKRVLFQGKPLGSYHTGAEWEKARQGWYYDEAGKVLVKFVAQEEVELGILL